MDMSKYLKMFLSESQEHLQNMDNLLLTLEKDPRDRNSIDALFREAHSVKGMSASMGFLGLAQLSHSLEDFLDLFRQKGEPVGRRVIDLLFEGLDLLKKGIEGIAARGAPDIDTNDFLKKVKSFSPALKEAPLPQEVVTPSMADVPATVKGEEEELLKEAKGKGVDLLSLRITIADDAPLPTARAYITLKKLKDLGELVKASPDFEEIKKGLFKGNIHAMLATAKGPHQVQKTVASYPDVAKVEVSPFVPTPPSHEVQRPEVSEIPSPPVSPLRKSLMIKVEARLIDDLIDSVGELITAKRGLIDQFKDFHSRALKEDLDRLENLTRELQQQALKLRMMPIELITDRFPRAVRDLARKGGKEVNLEILGRNIELDRAILEELPDPLLHILRNSIDHGIEDSEERVRRGKPRIGNIRLEASREKEFVLITIKDDGRGMDPVRIRRLAWEKGIISKEQHDSMSDEDSLYLITAPGFSTSTSVSEVSGRGVGMDVVKTTVEALRGGLLIESEQGKGTTVTLRLPLTLAIIQVLMVKVGPETHAIPLSRVLRTLEVSPKMVQRSHKQELIALEEGLVPLYRLDRLLGCSQQAEDGGPSRLVVLAERRGRTVGLQVDGLLGYREAVVKPLGKALKGLRGFAGVTILGDGSLVLILDLNTL